MLATELKRLTFISSMGISGEMPGETYRSVLDPYRDSAAAIEASGLEYTILRPGGSRRRDRLLDHLEGRAVPRSRRVAEQRA